jgi:hypothetical protein
VRLMTPAHLGLKRSLGQLRLPGSDWRAQWSFPRAVEFTSVDEASQSVKKPTSQAFQAVRSNFEPSGTSPDLFPYYPSERREKAVTDNATADAKDN